MQRWLRHETRLDTAMHLRGMHEERMAEIDGAGFAGGHCLRSFGSHLVKHQMRHSGLAGRCQESRHVEMRADAYSRWSVVFADVREQEQHQQRAPTRHYVDAPRGKIPLFIRIAIFAGKAEVDMPAGVTGIARM